MRTKSLAILSLSLLVGQGHAQLTASEDVKLLADNAAVNSSFGGCAAMSGDTVLIGANSAVNGTTIDVGAAYVFVRSGSEWIQQARLEPSPAVPFKNFAQSVGLSGDTAVVGQPFAEGGGRAWVFVRSGTSWSLQQQLVPSVATSVSNFGAAVAIDGDTLVVGAPGHFVGAGQPPGGVYVFVRNGTTWSEQDLLTANDPGELDGLGVSLDLEGDTLVAGTPRDDNNWGTDAGSAYVFVRSGTSWTQQAKLKDTTGAAGDQLGTSVSLSGETVALGAFADKVSSWPQAGSVSIFTRSGTAWTQQAKLAAGDLAANMQFGASVSLSGDGLAIGSPTQQNDNGLDAGAVYVFVRGAGTWSQELKLLASDGDHTDGLGSSVALQGSTLAAGAPGDINEGGHFAGSAYIEQLHGDWDDLGFALAGVAGLPQLDGTGALIGGSDGTLTLSGARPSAACLLFVSLSSTPTPFKGGTLAALPAVLLVPLVTSPSGTLPLTFTWPGGLPAATAFHFQYAIPDPAAVQGVALSPLERGTTP